MKQEDAKFSYTVESTMDLDEVLETVFEQLGAESAKIQYFSLSQDDLITEEMKKEDLISKALELRDDDRPDTPSIVFPSAEVIVHHDEEKIEILSKVKLDFSDIDDAHED